MEDADQIGPPLPQLFHHLGGPVFRGVVDQDQLPTQIPGQGGVDHPPDDPSQVRLFVVDGNQDRKKGPAALAGAPVRAIVRQ